MEQKCLGERSTVKRREMISPVFLYVPDNAYFSYNFSYWTIICCFIYSLTVEVTVPMWLLIMSATRAANNSRPASL